MSAYFLEGEITPDTVKKLFRVLRASSGKLLDLYITTEGGCTRSMMEICDMIEGHGNVTTIAVGECSSSGAWILISGARAFATKSSEIMIHFGEESAESLKDKQRNNAVYKWMREKLDNKVNVTKKSVTRWMNSEKYFTAEDALKVGLIDGVIEWEFK